MGGKMKVKRNRELLLGKEFETNTCGKCVVVEYNSNTDVVVEFIEYPYVIHCRLDSLRKGMVKNPYYPTYYGKGYLGEGKYNMEDDDKAYSLWRSMILRAYGEKYHKLRPTYRTVEVCKEWLNFQNFTEWFYSQKFSMTVDEVGNSYALDKDILVKGNKIYSPDACSFVPRDVNSLLVKRDKKREELPIGVRYNKTGKRFCVGMSYFGKSTPLGIYDSLEEAFNVYKKFKENYIKEVANLWKDRIDDKVYRVLMNYEVHIDD